MKSLNDIERSHEFINDMKEPYIQFIKDKGFNETIPFDDEQQCNLIFQVFKGQIWDSFVLYLKETILIAELSKGKISKRKATRIDNYTFDEIKLALEELKLLEKDHQGWKDIQGIKIFRDTSTHQSRLSDLIKTVEFNTKKYIEKRKDNTTLEDIQKTAKQLINLAGIIDKNLMSNYDTFSFFFNKQNR